MFRPRNLTATPRRRAVILMVVLVLLTLFAIVGLAFVLYADSEAESSRVYRESATQVDTRPDVSPDLLSNWAVGEALFGVTDMTANNPNPTGGFSAMRGYDLARDMYGWNGDLPGSNIYAFNGVGSLHTNVSNPFGVDDHTLLSYVPYLADGFIRDPERLGTRAGAAAALAPYTGGWNSSYTYPDGNHVFLGAFDADMNVLARSFWRPYLLPKTSTGNACLPLNPNDPSYWTWFANANPNNAGETVPPSIRYASLRPRPADMLPGFPGPQLGGDLQNLPGPGGNDSVWLDLDFPIQVAADGTKYKPLFAFFIADLDNRVNLNAHGNIRGTGGLSLSDQGWGKWEVNVSKLGPNPGPGEWPNLFVGGNGVVGRYGPDLQPATANNVAASGRSAHVYGQADFDGSDDTGAGGIGGNAVASPIMLPGNVNNPATNYPAFPRFPNGYNNGYNTPPVLERTNHPLNYNSDWPAGDDTRFAASNLVGLNTSGNNNIAGVLGTSLGKLMPATMTTFHVRNMTTTESAGVDRAALSPWIFDRTSAGTAYGYGAAPLGANAHLPPQGQATQYGPNGGATAANRAGAVPASSEFSIDWRSADAALARVDLNRYLPPYPHQGQGTTPPATAGAGPLTATVNDRFDDNGPIQTQFLAAQTARQTFANDIYRALLKVTSVPAPATPAQPTAAELAPRRWLAQLAVNIVDFIDEDEISTPFNFYGTADGLAATALGTLQTNPSTGVQNDPELPLYWVFGTEMPKVVVNEVLAEYQTPPTATPPTQFNVRVFAELYSPLPSATQMGGNYPTSTQPMDATPAALWVGANAAQPTGYAPYNVVLADTNGTAGSEGLLATAPVPTPSPFNNDNVLGTPNMPRLWNVPAMGQPTPLAVSTEFQTMTKIDPPGTTAVASTIAPQQFVLVGPGFTTGNNDYGGTIAAQKAGTPGVVLAGTPVVTSANMQYKVQLNAAGTQWQWTNPITGQTVSITDGPQGAATTTGISVVLRRLANPHLPPNNQPVLANGSVNPAYNPYITVDYMRKVIPNEASSTQTRAYTSTAKAQPYASNPTQYLTQVAGAAATPPAVTDTFGWANTSPAGSTNTPGNPPPAPAIVPYNWLVHLDRQLISPMELLHVSGFHPHELTSRFISPNVANGPAVPYNHRVNWYNESTRLYRAFEVLTTRDRAAGLTVGGRRPGLVNINTVWNKEVIRALADAQTSNGFYGGAGTPDQTVDNIFKSVLLSRSPSVQALDPVLGIVQGQDRPFLSFGTGNLPSADPTAANDDATPKMLAGQASNTGIEDTFLRSGAAPGAGGVSNSAAARLFDVPPPAAGALHPYQTTELMTKIFGNVTTRSNVFAMWVTVGFFRVPDPVQYVGGGGPGTGPVRLAEEIGASTGTNIRHKFFVAVDRTRMTIARRQLTTTATPVLPAALYTPTQVTLGALNGTTGTNAVPWQIQPGSMLIIDNSTANEETVVVQQVAAGNVITATFEKAHAAGATVQIAGNPGPQPTWTITNPNAYRGMVLTYAVLQ